MMIDDLMPYRGVELQQTGIQQLMTPSLEIFGFYQEFADAFGLIQTREAKNLVRIEHRQFAILKQAKTQEARFQVHCDAYEIFENLPPNETLVAAMRSVKRALATRPR